MSVSFNRQVAVACLVQKRASRPSMTEVVQMLQTIKGSNGGSKLQATVFPPKNEISLRARKLSRDLLIKALDSSVDIEAFDPEAGNLIVPDSGSSVDQSPRSRLLVLQ